MMHHVLRTSLTPPAVAGQLERGVRHHRDSLLLLAPWRANVDETSCRVKHQEPTLTIELVSWLLDDLRANRQCRLVDLVDVRNDKGHIHPRWRCLKRSRDEVMRPLDDAELEVLGGRGAQLDVPIAVVLHNEAEQPHVEVTGSGEVIGADVRQDSAEGHGGKAKRECDA